MNHEALTEQNKHFQRLPPIYQSQLEYYNYPNELKMTIKKTTEEICGNSRNKITSILLCLNSLNLHTYSKFI